MSRFWKKSIVGKIRGKFVIVGAGGGQKTHIFLDIIYGRPLHARLKQIKEKRDVSEQTQFVTRSININLQENIFDNLHNFLFYFIFCYSSNFHHCNMKNFYKHKYLLTTFSLKLYFSMNFPNVILMYFYHIFSLQKVAFL